MSLKQAKRLEAVGRVRDGMWTMATAAAAAGLSLRQMRRLCRAVEADGAAGLVHGNQGRPPANKHSAKMERRVVELARKKYAGFNDQHLTEKLVEVEHLDVGRVTVRRWLRAAGVGATKKRRAPKHRRRRDRMEQAGMMLLWDGSRHDWLEGRGPMMTLVGAIDDATGEFLPGAVFVEQETTASYMHVLRAVLREYGRPWRCYGDRHGIFRRNDANWTMEEELRGEQDATQLGRVLKALEIERIDALSPQAKGRVERLWGTVQDRLVSELRLAKASTIEEANVVLARYRRDHNRHFVIGAANAELAWRTVKGIDIDRVVSFRYDTTVQNDNTVRLGKIVIDIPPGPKRRSFAKSRVEVRQLLNGRWHVYLDDNRIAATTTATSLDDLRPQRIKKRPVASRLFRAAVLGVRS